VFSRVGCPCFRRRYCNFLVGTSQVLDVNTTRSINQSIDRSIETVLSSFIFAPIHGAICIEGRELRLLSFLVRIVLELRPKDDLATKGVRKDAMRYFEEENEEEDEKEDEKEDEETRKRTGRRKMHMERRRKTTKMVTNTRDDVIDWIQ